MTTGVWGGGGGGPICKASQDLKKKHQITFGRVTKTYIKCFYLRHRKWQAFPPETNITHTSPPLQYHIEKI